MKDYFKHFYKKQLKQLAVFILIVLPFLSFSQTKSNNQQVKRLQRAIFIFNFAEQTTWQNQENISEFKIGVLGPDRTFIDLTALSKKRNINNKKVKVVRFNSVKDVSNIQLLYVNQSFNFDINYILNKISNQNVLLVSEDYSYKSSMINMVNIGDTFEYEINKNILKQENLTIDNSLSKFSISSSEKWKKLFKSTEASLNESKILEAEKQEALNKKEAEIQQSKQAIANQKKTITTQKDSITSVTELAKTREKWLKLLSQENNLQKQEINSKLALEKELEETILSQLEIVKAQEEKIKNREIEITNQQDKITTQRNIINENTQVLEEKSEKLKIQKTYNYLLIGIALLSLLGAVLLYINYKNKKETAKVLKLKNKAILKQSLLLEAKNNELEEFAYIASHDLKEPLITISGLIDILVEDYGDKFDEDGQTSLKYVKESSDRMKQLIDAILSYSRLGKTKEYATVDCNNVMSTLKVDLQNVFERTKTELNVNSLPKIQGSELEIRLLFQNLISNGIKFTKKNVIPSIKIDAEKATIDTIDYWKFSIADNGIGIPEKHKKRIFSIFQRLHSREEYEGTGIGLAHCKKIVEAHGGKIWLESKVNVGTTFFFTIPA